jgi:hypothetical protein
MSDDINKMRASLKISSTGYWESDIKLYHVRCEPLCDWIIDFLKDEKHVPLYDFGCGNGHYLKKISENGFLNLTGFEGKIPKYKQFDNIIEQDLSKSFKVKTPGNCIFLEVAEHIPEQFENIMIDNVVNACNNKLIMSWAVRGQGGDGHINCLDNHEVVNRFSKRGMTYLEKETNEVRSSIPNDNPYYWFKNTTLIFRKEKI